MKISILVIEDDLEMRKLLIETLCDYGFNVLAAEDVDTGEVKAIHFLPDIIVLNLFLPKIDGITLCRKFRNELRTSKIPILMYGFMDFDELGIDFLVANDYLSMPFDLDELIRRIKILLRSDESK